MSKKHAGSTCAQRELDWQRCNEMLDAVIAERDELRAQIAGPPFTHWLTGDGPTLLDPAIEVMDDLAQNLRPKNAEGPFR